MCKGTVNWEDVYIINQGVIPRQTLERLNERWVKHHGGIPVDLCIGQEMERLIVAGVVTVASCCGHDEWNSQALAFLSEKEKIESLGYTTEILDSGFIKFELKTGTKVDRY